MKIINDAFERYFQAREAQAERFVKQYLEDRGLESMLDISRDAKN